MISGPNPPHPRLVLESMLAPEAGPGTPSFLDVALEAGLSLIEREVEIDGLCVDFLARDASGLPVLLLAIDADDEDAAPMRVVDLVQWFRDNAFLVERLLARDGKTPGISWGRGFRTMVVTSGVSRRFFGRLRAMSDLDLEVFELTRISLRGETLWALQGVEPWVVRNATVDPGSAPSGLEDSYLADLCERLLQRLGGVGRELDVRGDRFRREVFVDGRRVLLVDARGSRLLVTVEGSDEVFDLQTPGIVDRIVDRFMRALLKETGEARAAKPAPRSNPASWLANLGASRLSADEIEALSKQ